MVPHLPKDGKHIFGPVPSRRLGMSLGVDLVPHKTCTLNCVYCESGRTTALTHQRKNYVPMERIKTELTSILATEPTLDFITFSGSGEPTLHRGIGEIIRFINNRYPNYNIALLTNGTLLYRPSVREQIQTVDVLKVSLDAASEESFIRINRPCQGLNFAKILQGLMTLRKTFKNQFWIEVFIVPGINDTPSELEKIRTVLGVLNPDKIQLNSLDRPGTESWVSPAEKNRLEDIAGYLYDSEIIKYYHSDLPDGNRSDVKGNITGRLFETLKRRPCTLDDMVRLSGIPEMEVQKHITLLLKRGDIVRKHMPRGDFYSVKAPDE